MALYRRTRVPNPALPGPCTKILVRQCHHSNKRIRFYTYQTTLGFGSPYLTAQSHQPLTCRPNARQSPPPSRLPVQTDSRRSRPSEAGAVLTTTPALSAPRGGRGLAIRSDTRPIRNAWHSARHAVSGAQGSGPTNKRSPLYWRWANGTGSRAKFLVGYTGLKICEVGAVPTWGSGGRLSP